MKLMVSVFAISALGLGAALAAPLNSGDSQRVLQLVPSADLTNITAEQSALLSAFVNQDDFGRSPSDADYVRAVLAGQVAMTEFTPVALSTDDAERVTLLVPGASLDKLTEDQARMLSTFVNSGGYESRPGAEAYVTAVLAGDLTMTPEAPGMLSSSDAERVRLLVPDAQLINLTEAQGAEISTFVNSGDYGRSPNDVDYLRSVLNG
jgi:hypothetical protein